MDTTNPYAAINAVEHAPAEARARFLAKTYWHLFGAIIGFVLCEVLLFKSGLAERIAVFALGTRFGWWVLFGGWMLLSWFASRTAAAATTKGGQYGALTAYVALESVLFAPILYAIVVMMDLPGVVGNAAVITIAGFAALTFIVLLTGKDFSFLRGVLMWGGLAALGLIVVSAITGWNPGIGFSFAMVAFAGAAILYDTSNVLHHYPEDRYVSASLQLFASVALLFWYVLQIVLRFSGDD